MTAPASRRFAAELREGPEPSASFREAIRGPFGRVAPRFEVIVVERASGATVLRVPVDTTRHEAGALHALLAADLDELDEQAFFARHGRLHRRR